MRGRAELGLFVESLTLLDVKASAADVKFALLDGGLDVSYEPTIGAGSAAFNAAVNIASDPPMLQSAQRVLVVEKVPVNAALTDTLLVCANPALKGSTVDGVMSFHLDVDATALDATWRTTSFRGRAVFENLFITPGGLLLEMLGAVDYAEPSSLRIRMGRHASDFLCVDGVVTESPLRLLETGDLRVSCNGNTTLGGNVDYVATLLLKETAWPRLQGAKLAVPITGTVAKPVMDTNKLRGDFQALLKAAAAEREAELLKILREELLGKE